MRKRLVSASVIAFALFAAAAGVFSLSVVTATPAEAKCGICPLYCIGVTCSNGHTYCNSCLAACAGATDCHVTGF